MVGERFTRNRTAMVQMSEEPEDQNSRFCWFCLKSEPEVGRLIESPGVDGRAPAFICRECVERCSGILELGSQQLGSEALQTLETAEASSAAIGDQLREATKNLSDEEFRVIELRYGLADGYSYSHEEIGKLLELSPERIAEIEACAVAKLKPDQDLT